MNAKNINRRTCKIKEKVSNKKKTLFITMNKRLDIIIFILCYIFRYFWRESMNILIKEEKINKKGFKKMVIKIKVISNKSTVTTESLEVIYMNIALFEQIKNCYVLYSDKTYFFYANVHN